MGLDESLITRFLAWSRLKGNSEKWVKEQGVELRRLARGLGGRPLETLTLRELLPLIAGYSHRIAVAKCLYAYLRCVTHELSIQQDPTFQQLKVPQSRPSARDKALQEKQVNRAIRRLPEPWRSRLALQAATGIHTTELLRFARLGKLVPYAGQAGAHAFIEVPHKSGSPHRVALGKHMSRVAKKVLEAGPFTGEFYHMHVRRVGDFTPGRLRHTVATELVNRGTDMAAVATFLGHRSPQTTRRWYAKFAVPRNPMLGARRGRQR